jgi:hypothetical protein
MSVHSDQAITSSFVFRPRSNLVRATPRRLGSLDSQVLTLADLLFMLLNWLADGASPTTVNAIPYPDH